MKHTRTIHSYDLPYQHKITIDSLMESMDINANPRSYVTIEDVQSLYDLTVDINDDDDTEIETGALMRWMNLNSVSVILIES